MASFSALGIGLSFALACILLGLVAELYYLLWWKKRISSRVIEDHYNNNAKEPSHLFCWRKPSPLNKSINNSQEVTNSVTKTDAIDSHEPDLELGGGGGKDFLIRGFGEEGVESEIMRLHNLCGPPRFLFTIKEETKDDMESDDGKSRGDRSRKGSRTRSLSDILVTVETPFLSPLASPLKSLPFDSYNHHGFNPLFESLTEAELNRLRSSPPPKFKFLKDAEEKLMRRLMEEAEKKALKSGGKIAEDCVVKAPPGSRAAMEEKDGPFTADEIAEMELHGQPIPQYPSTASQVLPLASFPSTFKPLDKNYTSTSK